MHNNYSDIISRISDPILWFDERAVPRFDPFSPNNTANIYADECCLMEIDCQGCKQRFLVAMSRTKYDIFMHNCESLEQEIRKQIIHYGDPPNIGCCAGGPTMNCEDVRIVEYWRRDRKSLSGWERVPELEINL